MQTIFCLRGDDGKICLELNKSFGFPDETSIEGGYDIVCTVTIDAGAYHAKFTPYYSATEPVFRFCKELQDCYNTLEGTASYALAYETDLKFDVQMLSRGKAIIVGIFQADSSRENILQFEINTDQSYFKSVIDEIGEFRKQLYHEGFGVDGNA